MDVNELLNTVEDKAKKSSPNKNKRVKHEDKSFDNVMASISQNWERQPQPQTDELKNLKVELEKAKEKIQALELTSSPLTKNEEKIIAAIRSEKIKQNTEEPQISSRTFRKEYKVSSDYYRPSIESLIQKKIIERVETKYAGTVKTYRWKILEQ